MFDVFACFKRLFKIDNVCIDNKMFHLHYKATVIILMIFSVVVTCRQYIGDSIHCIFNDISLDAMDTLCWSRLKRHMDIEVMQPGVDTQVNHSKSVMYKYYHWVCFILFLQAILFYVPRYLWKTWEGGRIKMLVQDLNNPFVDKDRKTERKRLLVDYFVVNLHTQNYYAFRFFFCEVLNFVNVVGQFFFMDYLFDGEFGTYGFDVFRFVGMPPEDSNDPMSRVFPKMAKCTVYKFGVSGSMQKNDGMCVLPLNIVNEKIYLFLWFWFVFLSALTGLWLVYRLVVIFIPKVRLYLLRGKYKIAHQKDVETINSWCKIGDWYLFYQMSKNMDMLMCREVISDLANKLEGRETM